MSNLVIYRKYRPKSFSEVIGQEHVVQTLSNAISAGMISHAYLFAGPRGSGKTTSARLLAKSLNCFNRKEGTSEPCNKCSSCLEISSNSAVDLIEIDAASHRGIDDIRELRDGIKFVPSKTKYKVFILDEAHQLTKEASNALLKTLEEPPSHAIFILATTEIHKMLPTIISRCQRFDFRKLTVVEIVKRLEYIAKAEKVKIEKDALELIALNAGGSVRDAESLFDQVLAFGRAISSKDGIEADTIKNILGLVEIDLVIKFCDILFKKMAGESLRFINELVENGSDLQEFSKVLVNYLRQVLIVKIMGVDVADSVVVNLTKEEIDKLKKQAASLEEKDIKRMLNLFLEADGQMKYSSIPQLPLELAAVEACSVT